MGFQPCDFLQAELGAARLSLLAGNDYSAFYPSADLQVLLGWKNFKVGSQVIMVRVAGPNGTGEYPIFWTPVMLRYSIEL